MNKKTSHLPKIVFIGASHVGKSTITKITSTKLCLQSIGTDTLLNHHNIYKGEEDEMLDWFEDAFNMLNPHIIDVGGNTLRCLNQEQLERFKKIIGENAIVYYLKPYKSNILSYLYLSSRVDKDESIYNKITSEVNQHIFKRWAKSHIKKDIYSPIFETLKTKPTIYTLKNKTKSVSFPISTFLSNKNYQKILENVSNEIIEELRPIFYPEQQPEQ